MMFLKHNLHMGVTPTTKSINFLLTRLTILSYLCAIHNMHNAEWSRSRGGGKEGVGKREGSLERNGRFGMYGSGGTLPEALF